MDTAEVNQIWKQLQEQISASQFESSLPIAFYLALGGGLSLYLRFLYNRFSRTPSGSDSLARVFPLLTLATVGVIVVVKSSVALSLGLVGALSIVRFRTAIKEPEELVGLFLCIAVGLALGAEQTLLALILVAVATVFILGMHFAGGKGRRQCLALTITGDSGLFKDPENGVLAAVAEIVGDHSLQRLDLNRDAGQMRITLPAARPQETTSLIAKLQERLPECEFSYVDVSATL